MVIEFGCRDKGSRKNRESKPATTFIREIEVANLPRSLRYASQKARRSGRDDIGKCGGEW
jgi:hypothetical protein